MYVFGPEAPPMMICVGDERNEARLLEEEERVCRKREKVRVKIER